MVLLALGLRAHPFVAQQHFTISANDQGSSHAVLVLHDSVAGIEATVNPSRGAQLSSFRVIFKNQWIELLHPADNNSSAQSFAGQAAILWPAGRAGYIPGFTCRTTSRQPTNSSLGFARNLPWTEVDQSADNQGARVTLELRDSPLTRHCYPFAFRLDASFELSGGQLTIDYTVKADPANSKPMIFSVGDQIAFKVPFVPGSDPAAMTFESCSTTQLLRDPRGFLSGRVKARSFASPLRLGDFDARLPLPLAGYHIMQPYALLRDPQGLSLRLTQQTLSTLPEPLVRFNVYGGPRAGFFTPQSWFGMQDARSHQAAVTLPPASSWVWRLQLKPAAPPPDSPRSEGVVRVAGGLGYVEGPVWSNQGFLIFSDMLAQHIFKMTLAGHIGIYRADSNGANGNTLDALGRLYSCERDGRRVVRMEKDGRLTVIASRFEGKRLNDPNDVVVRRDGQVYFSDSEPKDSLQHFELGYAGVYHVTPQGNISLVAKMSRPNGVTLTPDGRTLYIADTMKRKIVAYDLDADGNPSHERVFISGINGGPDGLRVAASGNVYIAARGIAVYSPAGKLIQTIELPETPANCTFGDRDLHTLYITARTSVYRVRIPEKGFLLY